MAVVKNMMVRVGADFSSLIAQSKRGQKATSDWAKATRASFREAQDSSGALTAIGDKLKQLAGLAGLTLGAKALLDFGSACIEAGASAKAADAQLDQVFGALSGTARESLADVAEEVGATEDSLKDSFNSIASFAKTTGMDAGKSLDVATRGLRAAADIAAFTDRELSDVMENLQGYLKGNFANDAALNLSSTEFTRNAAAMRLYGTEYRNLSEQQKQLTLLQMVEDANRASGAMGQAARESGEWAAQTRLLKDNFKALQSQIGRGFIALLSPVLGFANTIMGALVSFANGVSAVFSSVFGSAKTEMTAGTLTSSTEGLSDALSDVDSAADKASGSVGKTGSAARKSAAEQEKLNRALLGFDKITKLQDSSSSSSSGSSGGSGGGGSSGGGVSGGETAAATSVLGDVMEKTTAFSGEMAKLQRFLEGLNWAPLQNAWEKLKDGAGQLADVISKGLYWGYEHVLQPLAKWTIEAGAPAAMELLGSAFSLTATALEKMSPFLGRFWDSTFKPFFKALGEGIVADMNALADAMDGINLALQGDWSGALQKFKDSLKDLFGDSTLVDKIWGIYYAMHAISELQAGDLVRASQDFATAWGYLSGSDPVVHKELGLGETYNGVKASGTMSLWDQMWDKITGGRTTAERKLAMEETANGTKSTGFLGLWSAAWDKLSGGRASAEKQLAVEEMENGTKRPGLLDTLHGGWEKLVNGSGSTKKKIALEKDGWSTVQSWTNDNSGGDVAKGVDLAKGDSWKGKSVAGWVGKSLGKAVKAKVGLTKGWKGKAAKSLGIDTLRSEAKVTFKKAQVHWSSSSVKGIALAIPKIKWNAKGGILDGPTLFGALNGSLLGGGEAGREAVLPLEQNTGWMDDIARRVVQMLGGSGQRSQPITVQVVLDRKVVGQATIDDLNDRARNGEYPLAGVL